MSLPPKFVLTYFDARGRAEISRLIFAAAGIPYVDNRVQNWPVGQDDSPTRRLPYLTVENIRLPQSVAIARFLAREFNLEGNDYLTAAKCDAIVDTCLDFQHDLYLNVFDIKDDREKVSFSSH